VAVQADVDQIGRDLAPHRKVRCIAQADGYARLAQPRRDLGHEPRAVAHLERVPHRPDGERAQEAVEPRDVAREGTRQLPHHRRQLVTQSVRLIAQPRDGLLTVLQALVMRDEAMTLEREAKLRRRGVAPARVGLGA